MTLRRPLSLLPYLGILAGAAGAIAACRGTDSDHAFVSESANTETAAWETQRAAKESALSNYLATSAEDLHWFRDVPLGSAGIPFVVFKLLPEVMPDLWGPGYVQELGLFDAPENDSVATPRNTYGLPYGLGYASASKEILPGIRPRIVNLTCAACHTGRVEADGKVRYLVGAPSQTFVSAAWRYRLYRTVTDPRFAAANFKKVLPKTALCKDCGDTTKGPGWLYPDGLSRPQEGIDTQLLSSKTAEVLEGMKERVLVRENLLQEYIGKRTYKGPVHELLNGGTPGQVEAFGTAVSLLVPPEIASLTGAAQDEALRQYLPPRPAVIDVMSVWNQKDRKLAQWDGNIAPPLLRNLGAELGVIGDPSLVNFENGVATTRFVRSLPAPVYPFAVDSSKLSKGKAVYTAACANCHDQGGTLVKLAEIKTDPNRATGLTVASRKELAKAMVATCSDKKEPECGLPPEKALEDRQTEPGYLAGPLDGVWARAPYLHNGSVPTLRQLLLPKTRAAKFFRGNVRYDTDEVGFEWRVAGGPNAAEYNTATDGFANGGHEFTTYTDANGTVVDLEKDEASLAALLEYLKTL